MKITSEQKNRIAHALVDNTMLGTLVDVFGLSGCHIRSLGTKDESKVAFKLVFDIKGDYEGVEYLSSREGEAAGDEDVNPEKEPGVSSSALQEWNRAAAKYDFPPDLIGRKTEFITGRQRKRRTEVVIEGFKSRNYKNPILCRRVKDGRRMKCSVDFFKKNIEWSGVW